MTKDKSRYTATFVSYLFT